MQARGRRFIVGRGCREAVAGTVLVPWFLVWLAGCGDHRISLAEFLEVQEGAAKVAATQPAAARPEAVALIDRALGPYKVEPGDVLRVVVTQLEAGTQIAPVDARVDRKGEVELAGVGVVRVGGLELEDAEAAIRSAYVPKIILEGQGAVYVALVEPRVTEVLVIGAVTLPGLKPLRSKERDLLHAMVAAGGVSELASGEVTLKRLRDPSKAVTLELTKPEGLQEALALAPLESGDIVTVRAAVPNTVFVGGLVNRPSPQPYPQGVEMTVLQALAASGGLRTDVTPREGTLIRRMPDGRDVQVKLDLDRITTSKDPNITLAAGDVLWVPDTTETRIQDWVNRNLFFRAGISATANGNYGINYSQSGLDFLNSNARQNSAAGRSGGGGNTLQDTFDPFGFLLQNQALQQIPTGP